MENQIKCYKVCQLIWDLDLKTARSYQLIVLATSIVEVMSICPEDDLCKIEDIVCLGPITVTSNDKHKVVSIPEIVK